MPPRGPGSAARDASPRGRAEPARTRAPRHSRICSPVDRAAAAAAAHDALALDGNQRSELLNSVDAKRSVPDITARVAYGVVPLSALLSVMP